MGIKFRGKQSTGNPAGGAIKERELEINLADKTLFTSSDGIDIIKLGGDPERGGVAWLTGSDYLVGDVVVDSDVAYFCNNLHTASAAFVTDVADWTEIGIPEKGGIVVDSLVQYAIGDMVTEAGIAYFANVVPTIGEIPSTTAAKWTEIGIPEQGGVAYKASTDYLAGDVITADDGTSTELYRCTTGYTSAVGGAPADFLAEIGDWILTGGIPEIGGREFDGLTTTAYLVGDIVSNAGISYRCITPPATAGTWLASEWETIEAPERGGVLHNDASFEYIAGDTATVTGSEYIYHCILDHTSAATCVGDTTNWTQPAVVIPVYEYNFPSTITTGTIPPALPVGPHDHEHAPGTPDELGAYYFSVELGSTTKSAEVYVDGFKLPSTEYDLSNDGYVYILSPCAANSWVSITI